MNWGYYLGYIGDEDEGILGIYAGILRDNGKENGKYYLGFRV